MEVTAPNRRVILGLATAFLLSAAAQAEPPTAVLDIFRDAVQALASRDVDQFFTLFDRTMPGYAELRTNVGRLIAMDGVASTIEPVANSGDDDHQTVQLDWLLRTVDGQSHREVVKCTLERRSKKWKITALEPVSFFKFE